MFPMRTKRPVPLTLGLMALNCVCLREGMFVYLRRTSATTSLLRTIQKRMTVR